MLVLTRHCKLQWAPVIMVEHLDFTERDLQSKQQEALAIEATASAAARHAAQEEVLKRVADGLRRTDPANAECLIAEIRAQHTQASAGAAAAEAKRRSRPGIDDAPVETMLRRVRAGRASLGPEQLAAQARLGVNGLHPADVPLKRYPLLARPDPAVPWDRANPASAQTLMIRVSGGDRFDQPLQRLLEALDLDAREALVRARRSPSTTAVWPPAVHPCVGWPGRDLDQSVAYEPPRPEAVGGGPARKSGGRWRGPPESSRRRSFCLYADACGF